MLLSQDFGPACITGYWEKKDAKMICYSDVHVDRGVLITDQWNISQNVFGFFFKINCIDSGVTIRLKLSNEREWTIGKENIT